MFTPQKLWSLTPRSERGQKNGQVSNLNPNSKSPRNNGDALAIVEGDGPLVQDSVAERVSRLENELFEYQYNMGLLLIEKKEWTSKYEELNQALADTNDTLRREETAHISAISELEKREENLKKALGVERQCVRDLEKALHEMRSEHAEIKFNADSKLAEANLLVTTVEEKSLEVESKIHAADAKLAEVSRKSSEFERKSHELEAQENTLRRERSFFTLERKTHETSMSKQREDLREWERKLQEAEERLADSRRLLNQREEMANESDKMLKEKQNDLEELRKKIEISNVTLKSKEDDISSRISNIVLREKEADEIRKSLEAKEKQLNDLEDDLTAREKLEIQKLVEEHESMLAEKKREFDLEMEQKRKLHDEQLKDQLVEVEKREAEIAHVEEKVTKREQAIEKKLEKVRDKETNFDTKSKDLKEREKSLKAEAKSLENNRKQALAEKEELLSLKADLENIKAETEKQHVKLNEEREQLKVTEDERLELERMQSELKNETDKYRSQSEQLMKEMDDLKQEKEKFEKEWEDLDDKRAQIKKEQEDVLEQKQYLENLTQNEKEKLQKEKLDTEEYVKRELDALKLEKDSFSAKMEHEKSILAEKYQNENSQMLHDFEVRKQELEAELRKRQEEMESSLHEKEKLFEEEKERELNNSTYLSEVARREMEEMKVERRNIEKEKLEILENKKRVEEQQFEMKKDIEELVGLSQKLKDQRELFIRERDRFIAFAENQKGCDMCGEKIREFMLSDLLPLTELNNLEAPPLPRAAEDYIKQAVKGKSGKINDELSSPIGNKTGSSAGGTISWLRTCTKIFKFSPQKKLDLDAPMEQTEVKIPSGENEAELSLQVANDSFDVQIIESESGIRESKVAPVNTQEDSQTSKRVRQNANNSFDVQIIESESGIRESETAPVNTQEDSQTSKRVRQNGSRKGVRRTREVKTRTMKAVIDESEAVLGSGKDGENQFDNGNVEDSVYTNEESRAESAVGGPKNRRKRNRVSESQATASENQSEGRSDAVKDSDRPKRRLRVAAADQNLGQKRYNLRKPKISIATAAHVSLLQGRKSKGKEQSLEGNASHNVEAAGEAATSHNVEAAGEAAREEIQQGSGAEGGDNPVRSTAAASAFSADSSPAKEQFKYVEETQSEQVYTENVSVTNMVMSDDDEVIGTGVDSQDYKTESDDDNDDDGDDDTVDHPGQASIGKKLWTFLTT